MNGDKESKRKSWIDIKKNAVVFLKKKILNWYFLIFFNNFDVLILKIKDIYFNVFSNKKYF